MGKLGIQVRVLHSLPILTIFLVFPIRLLNAGIICLGIRTGAVLHLSTSFVAFTASNVFLLCFLPSLPVALLLV